MSKEFEKIVLKKLELLDDLSEEQKFIIRKIEKIDVLSKEFKQFRKEQYDFNEEQKKFNEEQKEINQRFVERLNSLEKSLIIIEDRVTNELPALFNADKARYQKQREIETELYTLGEITEKQSIRISALEYTSNKHEERLNNLVS